MSGYAEKQDWSSQSQYAASQGQGGYQQQPQQQPQYQPQGSQQVWNQQPYGQQQGGYQAPPSYPPQQGGEYQGSPYASPQGGYAAAPSVPGQYGSPQPQQSYGSPPYGAPPPSQGQFSALPPQGQYGSFQPPYGAPPQQQQWGGAPPQGPQGGPERRRSVCFKFSGTKQSILNSQVMDPYGKVPFIVGSDKKHTTVRASDGTTLAMVDWNHSIPVMHYGGKKLKCREWIVWDNHKQVRILNHAGKEYHWVTRNETVYLEPSDRPGFHILIWRDPTDVVEVEAFQESLIVPGLLEAAIVAIVIMQSGHKIGDQNGGSNHTLMNAITSSIGANVALGTF